MLTIIRIRLDVRDKILRAPLDPMSREQQYIETSRLKLHRDVSKWRRHQASCYPKVVEYLHSLPDDDHEHPEDIFLGLPSDFPEFVQREMLGMNNLATAELELRRGQANDALESLREDIRAEFCLRGQKRSHVHGHTANTRAQAMLQNAARKKKQVSRCLHCGTFCNARIRRKPDRFCFSHRLPCS